MKVILLKKIKGLGEQDDVKDVAEGYARNFLFPNNLAVQSSPAAEKKISDSKKREKAQTVSDLHAIQSVAGQLDGYEVEISEKVNAKGVLYAAVTPQKICLALKKLGYDIKPEQVQVKALKNSGTFPVTIKFNHGLEAEINVIIQAVS